MHAPKNNLRLVFCFTTLLASVTAFAAGSYLWPVPSSINVTQRYKGISHSGINIGGTTCSKVVATKSGTVTTTTTDKDGNKTAVTENTDGTTQPTLTNLNGTSSTTVMDADSKTETTVKQIVMNSIPTENSVVVTLASGETVKIVDNSKDFADVADSYWGADAVSDYAYEAMCCATMHGIINGMGDGSLAPQDDTTRAEVATMLMRFIENIA